MFMCRGAHRSLSSVVPPFGTSVSTFKQRQKPIYIKHLQFILVAVLINVLSFSNVFALPQGPQVEAGSAVFESPNPTTLNITADNNTIINFNSFNVASNEVVNIHLPSTNATLLSRDMSGSMSQILGSLNANGNLFLVNAQGINIGPLANVQVNNMVMSTLDIASNNFLHGNYRFEHHDGDGYGQVSNQGNIQARNLVLQGSSVNNSGNIRAEVGTVHLASGDRTTVSFDPQGLIQVAVELPTTGKGPGIANAVANSGTIEAGRVIMDARTTENIFEDVINQTGTVVASQIVEDNGVIRIIANGNVQVSGELKAPQGTIDVVSTERSIAMDRAMSMLAKEINIKAAKDVNINAPLELAANTTNIVAGNDVTVNDPVHGQGDTVVEAANNIEVKADVTIQNGHLTLRADSDKDGNGAVHQDPLTTISTKGSGNITIIGALDSSVANVKAFGDIILQPSQGAVVFNQQADSMVVARSMLINAGATVNAANATYIIGQDWLNYGNFVPEGSHVILTGPDDARVMGSNNFNDFIIDPNLNLFNVQSGLPPPIMFDLVGNYVPASVAKTGVLFSKNVHFDAGATQTVNQSFIVQGGFGKYVYLASIVPDVPWKLHDLGNYQIEYVSLQNTTNINANGPPIALLHAQNLLGNAGFDFSNAGPVWRGSQDSIIWSDANNWDGGVTPGIGDVTRVNDADLGRRGREPGDPVVDPQA